MTEKELLPLNFELVRDEYPDRWDRANTDEASIEILDEGAFRVTLADGDDTHEVLFAKRGDQDLGWCDCDGFNFHTTDGKGPCAHLCVLGKLTVFDEIPVPPVDELGTPEDVDDRDQDDVVDEEPEVLEEDEEEVLEDDRRDDRDAGAEEVQDGPDEIVVPDRDPAEIESAEEFVQEVAGVPRAFVLSMGRGDDAKPYVTKEGLNYIAHKQGLETSAEPLSPSWEEPHDMAAWRGIVRDQQGREWTDVGTAHIEHEDMKGAEANLDELASTRATNRALRLATGCGLASAEELNGDRVVDEQVSATEVEA